MSTPADAFPPDGFLSKAYQILSQVPLIDGHNDFPFMIRGWHLGRLNDVDARNMPVAHTDLDRLRQGRVGGVFWSAFVTCPETAKTNDFSTESHLEALRDTMQQIDIIHNLVGKYPQRLGLATSSSEAWEVFRSGRIASFIGVEGLHQIANSVSVMRNLHRLGVRYVTLAHDANNLYADSTNSQPFHQGLSERGVEMVREMNRVGMIIDLSHTSVVVQKRVLSLSRAPVIFSHSSCASLVDHPRNSPDEVLDMLRDNGGVFMITFIRSLVDGSDRAALTSVADHVQHVGRRIGYKHVGLGSDFDGVMRMPDGLDDVTKFPALVAELLRRGVSERSVRSLVGLNVLRVLDVVGEVADRMRGEGVPMLQDVIEPIWDEETKDEVRRVRGKWSGGT